MTDLDSLNLSEEQKSTLKLVMPQEEGVSHFEYVRPSGDKIQGKPEGERAEKSALKHEAAVRKMVSLWGTNG